MRACEACGGRGAVSVGCVGAVCVALRGQHRRAEEAARFWQTIDRMPSAMAAWCVMQSAPGDAYAAAWWRFQAEAGADKPRVPAGLSTRAAMVLRATVEAMMDDGGRFRAV